MEMDTKSIEGMKNRKRALEEALHNISIALAHEDYTKPFVFKRMDKMSPDLVNNPLLKQIVNNCIRANIGFDPSLTLQHIEHEALNQFNNLALEKIKGAGIPTLMEMRHELELLMLRDQFDHYSSEIGKMDKLILTEVVGVQPDMDAHAELPISHEKVAPVKKKKK